MKKRFFFLIIPNSRVIKIAALKKSFYYCLLPPQTYNTNEELRRFYKVLSTNIDGNTEFVSTVEGSYKQKCLVDVKFTANLDYYHSSIQLMITQSMGHSGIQRKTPLNGPNPIILILHQQWGQPSTWLIFLSAKVWK